MKFLSLISEMNHVEKGQTTERRAKVNPNFDLDSSPLFTRAWATSNIVEIFFSLDIIWYLWIELFCRWILYIYMKYNFVLN